MSGEGRAEEVASQPEAAVYLIPFTRFSAINRWFRRAGTCIQGHHGGSTHKDTLAYAVDFRLPEGTLILASRPGVVAACADHFRFGGVDQVLRPRANFVAIQHSDGTYARYFHLRHKGVLVAVGDEVAAGDGVGFSGNSGFSSTPHLHFDVVDVLPEDTAHLELSIQAEDPASSTTAKPYPELIPAIMASFSTPLSDLEPVQAELVLADPPDAHCPLANAGLVRGKAVLVDRGGCSFKTKTQHVLAAGAACILVANNNEGPELFCMGGSKRPIAVPAALISLESSRMIKQAMQNSSGTAVITLRNSEGFVRAQRHREVSLTEDNKLLYSTHTLPVPFNHQGTEFIPREGRNYPPPSRGQGQKRPATCCSIM